MTMPDIAPNGGAPVIIELADEAATAALAGKVAAISRAGDVVALWGDLGSGKTVFARAFINARTRTPEDVPSPTYTLVQTYDVPDPDSGNGGTVPIYHFDLFRVEDANEIEELGMDDAKAHGISLIEWPGRMGGLLAADRLDVSLTQGPDAGQRTAVLAGFGAWVARLRVLDHG